MHDHERIDFAAEVLKEFPRIEPETAVAVWARVKRHSFGVAVEAVQRHRFEQGLYPPTCDPAAIGVIAAKIVALHASYIAVPYGKTVDEVIAERAAGKTMQKAKADALAVVADLARLNPAELERFRKAAADRFGGVVGERLTKCDVQDVPASLAVLIADEIKRDAGGRQLAGKSKTKGK